MSPSLDQVLRLRELLDAQWLRCFLWKSEIQSWDPENPSKCWAVVKPTCHSSAQKAEVKFQEPSGYLDEPY